ncbi:hypothetical protein [Pseudodesulfovibrio portus]|uniref:DUF3892 domain-containing protein n=1 Tax=Pseudodesulfovibrio portus TaxID=231439 RepID=A0ABM8AT10_9BACT|nr:hypothetical protein [Pseudodesulfovibrio portus]BDQ34497.1 hypothetical protein JCM14722_20390 [Pseudodesulfovibrio portus]
MANHIKGNRDGENGRNESYRIPGRSSSIDRDTLVREVEAGKHPDFGTYTRNGETYVRANPDYTESNSVNNE